MNVGFPQLKLNSTRFSDRFEFDSMEMVHLNGIGIQIGVLA